MSAPAGARRHVTEACEDWPNPSRELAVLLTSELVTNAVLHGEPPITLSLLRQDAALRVEVADGSPAAPRPRPPSEGRQGGRGLALVAGLASAWGSITRPDGKVVWFTLQRSAGT